MIRFPKDTKKKLIDLHQKNDVLLEGNILKFVVTEDDDNEFKSYLETCITKDKENRKRRLDITKKIQVQNTELSKLNDENQRILNELQDTLKNVEHSKEEIEKQNNELLEWKDKNEKISLDLQNEMEKSEKARLEAENAKQHAINDLDVLQKKTQTELIGKIVKVALWVIISVGIVTTLMYIISIFSNKDTQMIGSTWSNMFGILLTNAFSIIGTIMGVKYASEKKED